MTPRTRVALVFGGASSEHAISCLTAAGVAEAIDPQQYEIVGIGIQPDGRWVPVDGARLGELQIREGRLPQVPLPDGHPSQDSPPGGHVASADRRSAAVGPATVLDQVGPIDVAFALLHGPFGEDGTIQGLFEMAGIPYVGSGVLASALGMDKPFAKRVLAASGIPTGPFVAITDAEWTTDRAACLESVQALTFPVFVKPARGGSSMGITRVTDPDRVREAIEAAREHDPRVIIEQGLMGARELECAVLQTPQGIRASLVAEITMTGDTGLYDFASKYLPSDRVQIDVPADLPPDMTQRVQQMAITVFTALGAEGLARVDFFLQGEDRLYCNEINTMPGFTSTSMYPRLWEASGIAYPELISILIEQARTRPLGLR